MSGLTHHRGRALIVAAIAVGITAIGVASVAPSASDAKAAVKTRMIYKSAVEWKGSVEVAKEPFPTVPLPAGGGYERFAPDATGKWSVETYRFDTAVVAACQGERVVLTIFGVNGKEHVTTVPDFGKNFTIRRGQMSTVVFRVPKTGIVPIICVTHRPSHTADLVVLPC